MMLRLMAVAVAVATSLLVPLSAPATARTCAPPPATIAPSPLEPVAAATSPVTTETSVHWTRVSKRVTHGDTALLEGQVVTEDGAITGADVDLFARSSGEQDWILVASTTSDDDTGVFAFGCLLPTRTTTYRAVYSGTLTFAASEGTRQVDVTRWMPDSMRQVSHSRFVYAGSVEPRFDGSVTLQRRNCASCAWRIVAVDVTDARSGWHFTINTSRLRAGEYSYRAMIPADERFGRSLSDRAWRIRVR